MPSEPGMLVTSLEKMKEYGVVKKTKAQRREYTRADEKELRAHSKAKTPVEKISKLVRRTTGALRAKARSLGIPLGHRRLTPKRAGKKKR